MEHIGAFPLRLRTALATLVLAASQPVWAGEDKPDDYAHCVRDFADGKRFARAMRYSDDLFRQSLEACEDDLAEPDTGTTHSERGVWTTKVYIETLSILNALSKPEVKGEPPIRGVPIKTQPAIRPAQGAGEKQQSSPLSLDRITQGDFAVLYFPWMRCAFASAGKIDDLAVIAEIDRAFRAAEETCEPVQKLADAEAVRLLGEADYEPDTHAALIADMRESLNWMVLGNVIRSQGGSPVDALTRGREVLELRKDS